MRYFGDETIHMVSIFTVLMFSLFSSLYILVRNDLHVLVRFGSLIIFVIAIWLMFRRDTFLPFLGSTVIPITVLSNDVAPEGANKEVSVPIDAPDGTRVIYWGAKESESVQPNPWVAYDDYSNAGVTTVKNGEAIMQFFCPGKYHVPSGKLLQHHIHYRTCCKKNVMMGPVQTVWIKC